MDGISTSLTYSQLALTREKLLAAMGYAEFQPQDNIIEKTDYLLNQSESYVNPSYSYQIYKGYYEKKSLQIENTSFHIGSIISNSLKGSTQFAVFTATAGTLFQQWIEDLEQSGDMVDRYIADCIGTEIAEATANFMQNQLERECRENGYAISNRYSPGYCGWDVKEQHKLFSLLGSDTCGIILKESGLMYPIKSVSGVIGIGKEVKRKEYGCKLCNYRNCYKRKE